MKIELRISPVHLYLVTPSDKSFLLWKWNLWCIIWFSLWKWLFILYDSCYQRGAPAPFHFMVGVSDRRVNLKHYTRGVFIQETRLHPSQLYVDIWIYDCWSTVNPITVHIPLSGQPGIHRASAHYRRLTNITLSKRYCSH